MPRGKKHTAERIISQLREAEVELAMSRRPSNGDAANLIIGTW
jgi:hypothetical protein